MTEKLTLITSEERRRKTSERLATSVEEALSEGKPCIEVKSKFGFPGQLYGPEIYNRAAAYLALSGVDIEVRRYKKRVPIGSPTLKMSRVQVYDVIDVVGSDIEPEESVKVERGEELVLLYPPPGSPRP